MLTTKDLIKRAKAYGMRIRRQALIYGDSVSPRSPDTLFDHLPRPSQKKWFAIGLSAMQALQDNGLAYTRYDLTPLHNIQLEEDLPQ